MQNKYENLSDEQIISLINGGDSIACDHLINKYKNLVRVKTRSFFLIGSDTDDIVQEGMIGLFKAIRDYKHDKSVSFFNFADICISRNIKTAVKSALRQKHIPLNSYISLNKENAEIEITDSQPNPEELFIENEQLLLLEEGILKSLSPYEKKVFHLYLLGKSYFEISNSINKDEKSIDNAIQRIKKKLSKLVLNPQLLT